MAFVLFGIVFFRLWYLQVLTGEQAVSDARQNRVRKVGIEAPRGDIVDRNGVKLVTTKVAAVVQMVPTDLPKSVQKEADDYRKALAAAEGARLTAVSRRNAVERQLRDAGRTPSQAERREPRPLRAGGRRSAKAERRELRRLRRTARRARPVAVPALPVGEAKLAKVYR